MKNYRYIVRDSSGARRAGVKNSVSSESVLAELREQNFTPISVEEIAAVDDRKERIITCRRANQISGFGVFLLAAQYDARRRNSYNYRPRDNLR